jgi:hypothetical protein
MYKGYQLIPSDRLDSLVRAFKHSDFLIAIHHWLIPQLNAELKDQLANVELEVIKIEYLGAYPGLGVHYLAEIPDVAPLIEATIDRLLQERPVSELITFIVASGIDWQAETSRIMTMWE